jgi:putative hemolysin
MDSLAQLPIAAPLDPSLLVGEVAGLRERDGAIAVQGQLEVFLGTAEELPSVLLEIGRLREMSFRAVGEGSGKERDLDEYDTYYLHLFLWDREQEVVAGAYRVGRTDVILSEYGPQGLYCSTLFAFEQPFLDHLSPGLELGRSFVALDYQRSLSSLLGLWKGLAAYVCRNPRYGKLFGPVSISNDYTSISKDLIVRFMREKKKEKGLASFVKPYHPFDGADFGEISPRLENIEEVSARVSDLEPDGKGVPILLKQYLKLNATLLEFNVDPAFGNCLDALVLLDLHRTPDRILGRYMGKKEMKKFRAEAGVR